ncbi:PAS domain-containing protein [Peribacillus simplex]|uniref:PAS domain-containing protein n=1 Tax=Peribacillus simplex TaxID=1478 RepID=UPI0025A14441|nr:PAS domain-containing protein [Peribacillus simplex]MDM5291853.1 PAS domain-containing protein [Peribacillus simplex]
MKEQSNNKNTASISENSIGRWKAIIESINDGVLMIDHNGYERMINPEYTRITGVTTAIIGKSLGKYRSWAQPELTADSLRPLKILKLTKRCNSTFTDATPCPSS